MRAEQLNSTQIDIWYIALGSIEDPTQLSYLSSDELIRYHRFHFPKHKARFLQAHVAVKKILGRYLNLAPQTLVFELDRYGKPYFENNHSLTFNLTHSGDHALLAVGKEHPVGVDIERFSSRPYEGIARHVFSQREQAALHALPKSLQPLGFFNVWTQKEALIKAIGLGLGYPTGTIDLPLFASEAYVLQDPLEQGEWCIQPFMPRPGYAAACCYHPSVKKLHYIHHDPS